MVAKKKPSRTGKLRSPRAPSLRRGRSQVNILLSDELKDQILGAAQKSGRTFSAQASVMIEIATTVTRLLAIAGLTVEQVAAKAARKSRD
jgi:hypothetical protein